MTASLTSARQSALLAKDEEDLLLAVNLQGKEVAEAEAEEDAVDEADVDSFHLQLSYFLSFALDTLSNDNQSNFKRCIVCGLSGHKLPVQ